MEARNEDGGREKERENCTLRDTMEYLGSVGLNTLALMSVRRSLSQSKCMLFLLAVYRALNLALLSTRKSVKQ